MDWLNDSISLAQAFPTEKKKSWLIQLFKKINAKVILDKHQSWTPALNLHSHNGQSGWLLLGPIVAGLRGFGRNYSWSTRYGVLSKCAFTHNFSRRRKWNSGAVVATKLRVSGFDVCLVLLRLSSSAHVTLNIEFSTTSVGNILRETVSHFQKKKVWQYEREVDRKVYNLQVKATFKLLFAGRVFWTHRTI